MPQAYIKVAASSLCLCCISLPITRLLVLNLLSFNMTRLALPFLAILDAALAYPWVANMPGVDSSLLFKNKALAKRQTTCPDNPNHPGAAPYSSEYPYTGAQNGLPGSAVGGIQVPAPGDTAHQFTAPGDDDIRGPCPGLNTAANHNVF